jgi:hypothetical protein
MNVTDQVRDILGVTDIRVIARIGTPDRFTDQCDICLRAGIVHVETSWTVARGADVEDATYCLDHAIFAVDGLTYGTADEIAVTVPASLLAVVNSLAA